jgi:hypothetical protein
MPRKAAVLSALMATFFLPGVFDGWCQVVGWTPATFVFWAPAIVQLFIIFYWLRLDSEEHKYKRSGLLNVGVILIAPIALPIYLYKSRPAGARLKAFGWFMLAALGTLLVSLMGSLSVVLFWP